MRITLILVLVAGFYAAAIHAGPPDGEVSWPNDIGFVNVKTECGAVGDGKADDTAAFKKAFDGKNRNIFIPAGSYLLSDTIVMGSKRRIVQGAGVDLTVIKLRDGATAFNDPAKPRFFLSNAFDQFDPKWTTGVAFRNSLHDLTIDIGSQNPGAIGLHWIQNNEGSLTDLAIISSDPSGAGKAGLAVISNWPGPGLIQRVHIKGFDCGILSTVHQYSLTLSNVSLESQRICGIDNTAQILNIENLTSKNACPAIRNSGSAAMTTIINSELLGGSGGNAIENNEDASLFARNIKTEGYARAIRSGSSNVAGTLVEEFVSHPSFSNTDNIDRSLALPIEQAPVVPNDPVDSWANVSDFGAIANDKADDSDAVQKAVDSGKSTVYFPSGSYELSKQIHIRGKVQRIVGGESIFNGRLPESESLFRVEDGAAAVCFERFWLGYGSKGGPMFEHASKRTLIVRHITGGGYINTVTGGKVFFEDFCGGNMEFRGQSVWARQLNPEAKAPGAFNIRNIGGSLWVLGLKTEGPRTAIETRDGGKTEVLGGYLYPSRGTDENAPAFLVEDSDFSGVYANQHGIYRPQVRFVMKGVVTDLNAEKCPTRPEGVRIPLIVTRKAAQ